MSARDETATPHLPTSPRDSGWSGSRPMRVGRSKATESPPPPCSSRYLKRSLVWRGGAEAGELAHGPQPAPVHRLVDAAGVGELPGVPEVPRVVDVGDVRRAVQRARSAGRRSSWPGARRRPVCGPRRRRRGRLGHASPPGPSSSEPRFGLSAVPILSGAPPSGPRLGRDGRLSRRRIRAGTPAAMAPSGRSEVTTPLAPTTTLVPRRHPVEHLGPGAEPDVVAEGDPRRRARLVDHRHVARARTRARPRRGRRRPRRARGGPR